jgi:Predicted membrane protein
MLKTFYREHIAASLVLTLVRIYLGWEWLNAGWHKVFGPEPFNAAGFLKGAVQKATGDHPAVQGWWADFLTHVAIPNAKLFSFLVAWGELLVGLGLILGCFTTFAALMGIVMNFAFLLSGTTSTNPQMLILALLLIAAGANARRIGLDRWVLPYLRNMLNRYRNGEKGTTTNTKLPPVEAH